jgi:beta-N-acetylhexosaminidase
MRHRTALSKNAVGGILYFKQNLKDKEQVTEMLKNTSAMSKYPLFLAVDEEGGKVSRVADAGIDGSVKVDSEADIAAGGDTSKGRRSRRDYRIIS